MSTDEPGPSSGSIASPRRRLSSVATAWLGFAFWAALALGGVALSFGFDTDIPNYRYGPAGWPRTIFALMLLAAAVQLAVSLRQCRSAGAEATESAAATAAREALAGLPVSVVAACLVYIAILPQAGFFATTPVLVAAVIFGMGQRSPWRILTATGIIYGITILVFVRLLYVPLPLGSWPGFYDFGSWLVSTVR